MKRLTIGVLLAFAIVATAAKDKQRVVSIYEFGCIINIQKGPKTRVEVPLDEYGREDRPNGLIIGMDLWLPPQGKGHTPSPCAYAQVKH